MDAYAVNLCNYSELELTGVEVLSDDLETCLEISFNESTIALGHATLHHEIDRGTESVGDSVTVLVDVDATHFIELRRIVPDDAIDERLQLGDVAV